MVLVYAFGSGIIPNSNLGSISDNVCPSGIIPDRLLVLESKISAITYSLASGNTGTSAGFVTPSWADGSPINYDIFNSPCHQGASEGENINYFYCSFEYSKSITNVSSSGIIGKTMNINYEINLTMEKDTSSLPIYDSGSASLLYYKIISSECLKQ